MDPDQMALYQFTDSNAAEWRASTETPGVEIKDLGQLNGQVMELIRFAPHTGFPNHQHLDPEYVYMLEGSGRQADVWMHAGWGSIAAPGSLDVDFVSGPEGCVMLSIYGDAGPVPS